LSFYKLKLSDIIVLAVLFILGYFFTETQKYFVPAYWRVYSYLAMVAVMYSVIFALIAPKKPMELANSLAVVFGVVVLAIILIEDIMIKHLFSWRTIVVFLGVVVVPYTSAWAYLKSKKEG
jgi:hypothetical protein